MRLRPLVGLLIGAIIGIIAHRSGEIQWLWAGLMLILISAAYSFGRKRWVVGMLLVAVALSSGAAYWRSNSLYQRQQNLRAILAGLDAKERLTLLVKEDTIYPGVVESERYTNSFRMVASILGSESDLSLAGQAHKSTARELAEASLLLYLNDPIASITALEPGDIIAADIKLQPAKAAPFEGGFSLSDYHQRLGVCGSATASKLELIEQPNPYSPRRILFRVREQLITNTLRLIPGERGEVLSAVLFGYRQGVSPQTRAKFRRTGTGHLLAISGLHVGLVTGLAWFFFRKVGGSHRTSAAAAIIICLLYLGISGARPSAVRAAIMATVYLGGFLVCRRSNLINALACAALIILFHNPASLTDAGFLLSFTAVIFLSRLGQELRLFHPLEYKAAAKGQAEGDLATHSKAQQYLQRTTKNAWSLFLLAIAAWIGLWPLSAYYFKLLAFSSLFLNIFVIPWLSVVLIGGLLLQAGAFLPAALAAPYAAACASPMQMLLIITESIGKLPYLVLPVNPPAAYAIAIYYSLFFAFFTRRYLHLKLKHFILPGIAVLALMISSMQASPPPPGDRITVLRAGWGECAIIEPRAGSAIIIGHLPRGGRDAVEYLRTQHRDQVSTVIQIPPVIKDDGEAFRFIREQYSDSPGYTEYTMMRELDPGEPQNPSAIKVFNGGEVPGAPGLRIILTRDYKNRLLGWTIYYNEICVTISEGWWASSLLRDLAKTELPAIPQATILRLRDRKWPEKFWLKDNQLNLVFKWKPKKEEPDKNDESDKKDENDEKDKTVEADKDQQEFTGVNSFTRSGPVFMYCATRIEVPKPFLNRRDWGAIRLVRAGDGAVEVSAYDGERWEKQIQGF